MLEARSLSKLYPGRTKSIAAVADVELQVAPGEFVAVVGRSGSGKSTLLGMLGGQSRPSAGAVLFRGRDVWGLSAAERAEYRRGQVGFVFQFPALLPMLRVVDNVALPALIGRGSDPTQAYAFAQELLHLVGLGDRWDAYPGELSGGQQRRVAVARALINRPPLVLADEPTAELDAESEREVFAALVSLHRRHGTALVVVTHSPSIARQADRVVHLDSGRITSTELVTQPERDEQLSTPLPPVTAPERPAELLGSGWRTFGVALGVWVTLAALLVATLNYGAALWQRRAVEDRRDARTALQELALQQVRADVSDIAYGPNGDYLVTVTATNLQPDRDVFLMVPTVRAFVQVGRDWQEVPTAPQGATTGRVAHLTGPSVLTYAIRPKLVTFEEQLAGYMHVRFTATMLLARDQNPNGDIFERVDDYYVYLKPHGADDTEIARRNGWGTKPPLWIPMPAH